MLKERKRLSAQSTLEYAVLIVLVAIALLATQVYVKRALQGRFRSTADDIGEQFSPGASNLSVTINSSSVTEEFSDRSGSRSKIQGEETTNRTTNLDILPFSSASEYWATCGNGICEPPGENTTNCPADCI